GLCFVIYRHEVDELHTILEPYFEELLKTPEMTMQVLKKISTFRRLPTIIMTIVTTGMISYAISEKFREAIYASRWVGNTRLKSSIIIMLSQKPLILTACNLLYVTIDMFVKVSILLIIECNLIMKKKMTNWLQTRLYLIIYY
ncbi:GSCOCT00014026001.2-RA-CDS, partial [Cotesia congregata]